MGDRLGAAMRGTTPTPPPLDRSKLLAWLLSKRGHRSPLTGAIYDGMRARIERGDFDTTEEARR